MQIGDRPRFILNRLKAAGVPLQLAKAEAEALSEVFEADPKALVTKEALQNKSFACWANE
jgi:hypothetical protein